jgi:alpha-L-arabinofuranosidase
MKKNIALFAAICLLLALGSNSLAQQSQKNEFPATVAGISNGDISKDVLLNAGVIECSYPNVKIISFDMSAQLKNNGLVDLKGNGNTLNEEMKSVIKNMEIGNKVIFEQIYAKSEAGKTMMLNAIILTVK